MRKISLEDRATTANLGCMKFRRAKAFVPGGSLEVGCHVFDHRCWPPRAASCTTEQIRCNCKVFFLFVVVVTHIFERNAVSMRHMETLSSQKSAGKFARTKQPTRRRAILRLQALPGSGSGVQLPTWPGASLWLCSGHALFLEGVCSCPPDHATTFRIYHSIRGHMHRH